MANYFDTGILLTAGFSLSSQAPLDGRSVVELLTDLDTHIAENRAYEVCFTYSIRIEDNALSRTIPKNIAFLFD